MAISIIIANVRASHVPLSESDTGDYQADLISQNNIGHCLEAPKTADLAALCIVS